MSIATPPAAAEAFPSPNFGPRRDGLRPELVVLHYTAMADPEAARRVLCDPEREVSAHYLIYRDGLVLPLVPEDQRAWHAGKGNWRGQDDINSRSIGIELDNDGTSPFSAPLMDALEALLPGILARWQIPPEDVIGHSDMAPTRKIDPGPRFDWQRLARQGLAVWPEPDAAGTPQDFFQNIRAFGYPDLEDEVILQAFRLRFHPAGTGPVTEREAAMAADLARRFGIDRASPNA